MTPPKTENVRNDILLQAGPYPAILVRMYGMGTQEKVYSGQAPKLQPVIKLIFELPTVMHEFVEGRGQEPKWIQASHTFSLYGSSNLAKLVVSAIGRPLTDDEVNTFDIGQLLGKTYMAQVSIVTSKKDSSKQFNVINTAGLVTEQVKNMYKVDWAKIVARNEIYGFAVDPDGKCFTDPQFGKLDEWVRKDMLNSVEGKAFIAGGGIPTPKAEAKAQNPQQQVQQAQPVTQQATQQVQQQTAQATQPVTQPVQQPEQVQNHAQAGQSAFAEDDGSFPNPDNFM